MEQAGKGFAEEALQLAMGDGCRIARALNVFQGDYGSDVTASFTAFYDD